MHTGLPVHYRWSGGLSSGGGARTSGRTPKPSSGGAYYHHHQHQHRWSRQRRLLVLLAACLGCTLLFSWLLQQWAPGRREVQEEGERQRQLLEGLPSPAFCSRRRPPLVCAHSGDTSTHPPNTQQAFKAAIDLGVDCVEVDAARTSDGQLVVLHVRELQQLMGARFTPGMQVGDLTWHELQGLQWPQAGQRVVRVRDALELLNPFMACIILDIKTYDRGGVPQDGQQLVDALLQLVHDTRCTNCLIWAKSDQVVHAVKAQSPGQRVGVVLMNDTAQARAAGMHQPLRLPAAEVVGSHWGMVETPLLQLLHQQGKQLYVWTVNDASVLRGVLDVGVDALVTNQPALAQQAIAWRVAHCTDSPRTPATLHEDLL